MCVCVCLCAPVCRPGEEMHPSRFSASLRSSDSIRSRSHSRGSRSSSGRDSGAALLHELYNDTSDGSWSEGEGQGQGGREVEAPRWAGLRSEPSGGGAVWKPYKTARDPPGRARR